MNVRYGRISTAEQNEARQILKGEVTFIDKCSGSIPFMERPQARKLLEFLKSNPNAITTIVSVDRIGRSTLDILQTIHFFKNNGLVLRIENLGMDNLSPFFDLMIIYSITNSQRDKGLKFN